MRKIALIAGLVVGAAAGVAEADILKRGALICTTEDAITRIGNAVVEMNERLVKDMLETECVITKDRAVYELVKRGYITAQILVWAKGERREGYVLVQDLQ
ncbi:hypothetical protein [Rhizobium oryzicola]|uniref:Uncharacterized protein n=1 Tax=Rhizobium oryzicola TaxID=1232668 RepID=A0ABT8SSA1_9HYPH|nr:hypothetical protein [Rhizobium oryzicola]MDO1580908.1 hypothetical protein [Rhizobium oryzicola]